MQQRCANLSHEVAMQSCMAEVALLGSSGKSGQRRDAHDECKD